MKYFVSNVLVRSEGRFLVAWPGLVFPGSKKQRCVCAH